MTIKKSLLHSLSTTALALLLSACSTFGPGIKLKDQEVCTVAGVMAAGMNCGHTIDGDTYEKNIQEMIAFLEPSKKENRSGAMCLSQDHFNVMKTTLDQACEILGSRCTLEMKAQIQKTSDMISGLSVKSATTKGESMGAPKILFVPQLYDVSQDALFIQDALTSLGRRTQSNLGIYDALTIAQVAQFQKENGLDGTGIIGPKTVKLLGLVDGLGQIPVSVDPPTSSIILPNDGSYTAYTQWFRDRNGWTEFDHDAELSKGWPLSGLPSYKTVIGSNYAWCQMSLNSALFAAGYRGTGDAGAVSSRTLGDACGFVRNAIMPITHPSGEHHVNIFDEWEDDKKMLAWCWGGNQNNRISRALYDFSGNKNGHDQVIPTPRAPRLITLAKAA